MFFSFAAKKLENDVKKIESLAKDIKIMNIENKTLLDVIKTRQDSLNKLIAEKESSLPWLSNAIADIFYYKDEEIAYFLKNKPHPAHTKAEEIKQAASEKREWIKNFKQIQYLLNQYESYFPWIKEYVDEDLDALMKRLTESKTINEEDIDPVLQFMTRTEYDSLSTADRNQRALDRFFASRKKPYEIGRDYERYIGYLYEKEGYKVSYYGIEEGFEDLGRDLICIKGNETEVVQCKNWAKHKTIHEKHINQLFGTTVKYFLEHNQIHNFQKQMDIFPELIKSGHIKAAFITSTTLSETAMKFAEALGIRVVQNIPMKKDYPVIKCNIGNKKEKIYHLPFDQQYDKTMICKKGECYVATVQEAEDLGFRRAYRWMGN